MVIRKKIIFPFILMLPLWSPVVFAQQLSNTLLWRISGKGLKEPSYLYGTMHLSDKRLFNLGDSLYGAIEHTQGFAIEVNPEDMTGFVIDEIKKQVLNSKNLKDMLNEEDYKKYAPILSKKFHKPKDNITSADILKEKNKWINEQYKTGKMQTFLDAYLFDLARRQGKWTGGVEDIDDQMGLINDLVDKTDIQQIAEQGKSGKDSFLEKFINTYIKGDLNTIDSIMNLQDSAERDKILVKRNKKMAMRMDSLSAVRTMVFAVGAAHLPGPEGLIALLHKRGFTVEPVFSDKKMDADTYPVKEIPLVWQNVQDENGMYEIDMPGKPGNMQMYNIVDMKIYIDIFSSTGYFVTAIKTLYDEKKTDSLLDAMANKMFVEKNIKSTSVPVTLNGAKGKIYTSAGSDLYQKAYLLEKGNTVYMALATTSKDNETAIKNVDHFFSTFKVKDAPIQDASLATFVYTDSVLAYSVQLSAKPKILKEQSGEKLNEGIKTIAYTNLNNQQEAYLFFGVNTILPRRFIENDSIYLEGLKGVINKQLDSVVIDTMYFNQGYRVLSYGGYMKSGGFEMDARYYMRGNRWYALAAAYNPGKPHALADRFFQSFRMLDYPAATWRSVSTPDQFCSTWMPAGVTLTRGNDSANTDIDVKYNSYDSTRSDSYDIIGLHFDKYFWSESDSAFWTAHIELKAGDSSGIISKKPVVNGDAKGWEVTTHSKGSAMCQRKRYLLYGDTLYTLFACKPKLAVDDENTNRFFDDFRFKKPVPLTSLFQSKAAILLDDLFSKDSATAGMASQYIYKAHFTEKDLPLLYKALLRNDVYANADMSAEYVCSAVKSGIVQVNDSSSFHFAADHYAGIADSDYFRKNDLLEIMAGFPSAVHFDTISSLLRLSPPHAPLSYKFINALKDTAALTARIALPLLPLLKDSFVQASLINIYAGLIDSNLLTVKSLFPYEPFIMQCARARISKLNADKDEYSMNDVSVIEMLGLLNTASANAVLRKWLTVKDNNYQRIMAIKALLKNKQPVNAELITSIAADKAYRLTLYTALKEIKKELLFPVVYKTQKMLAQSEIYEMAADDDTPSAVIFLSDGVYDYKGEKRRFYFYKVQYTNDKVVSTYLACAGPYETDLHNLDINKVLARIYYEEELHLQNIKELKSTLIKQFEENE